MIKTYINGQLQPKSLTAWQVYKIVIKHLPIGRRLHYFWQRIECILFGRSQVIAWKEDLDNGSKRSVMVAWSKKDLEDNTPVHERIAEANKITDVSPWINDGFVFNQEDDEDE